MARNKSGGWGQWFHAKLSHKEAAALYEHCDQQDMSPEALLRHAFITYDTVMKTPGALEAISKLTREMTGPKVLLDHPSAPPCTCKFINEPNAAGMSTDPNCPQHGYLLVRSTQETSPDPATCPDCCQCDDPDHM